MKSERPILSKLAIACRSVAPLPLLLASILLFVVAAFDWLHSKIEQRHVFIIVDSNIQFLSNEVSGRITAAVNAAFVIIFLAFVISLVNYLEERNPHYFHGGG
ncbi:MAG: hypothetical protein Kow00107_10440 [Planctomycetota bacterium]